MTFTPVSPAQELNLFEIFNGIKRRFYLITGFTILFLIFGIIITSLSPRKYEAQTLIALQTSEQNFGTTSSNTANNAMSLPPVESVVLSQVEVLLSQDMAELVVKDMQLDQDAEFWGSSRKPTDTNKAKQRAILNVMHNISVKPVGRSLVIDIRYQHTNPVMAARIANRYAELFQEQQVKEKISSAKTMSDWLERRVESLNNKLRDSARAVEEYRAKEDLIDGAKAEITSQQISDISSQLMKAQAEEAGILARKTQIASVIQDKKSLDSVSEVKDSHLMDLFKRDEVVLTTQLAQLKSKYGPNHPKILSLKAELGELNYKKQAEVNRLTSNVDNEAVTIAAKINLLKKNLQEAEDKRRKENYAAIGLRELQSEADANRDLYNNFLNRYKESKMLGDNQQPDTKIISIAKTPSKYSGINPVLIIMVISFGGFIFGVLLALLLEQLDITVRTSEQLKQLTGMDTLASIPKIPAHCSLNYIFDHPYSPVTEALRTLCLRLLGRLQKTPSVITLTSCLSEEGKTKTALGMAQLMAKSGLRVLLLDGNFRYPGLQKYFNGSTEYSVTDYLFNRTAFSAITVQDNTLSNLVVVTGKSSDADDISLLSEKNLRELIEQLKLQADIILIDAPSSEISESQLFNKVADHCLIAVRWDHTSTRIVTSVYEQMRRDDNKITGFIITDDVMA